MLDVPNPGETDEIAVNDRIVSGKTSTASIAICTSNAWIFLPRYSGVRPTISPAMKTDRMMKTSMPYMPAPTPPKIDLAEHDVDQRHQAAERRERVVPAVDRAAARVGGHRREERRVGDAEADFLAFHVAARRPAVDGLVGAGRGRAAGCRAPRPSRRS